MATGGGTSMQVKGDRSDSPMEGGRLETTIRVKIG